MGEEADTGLEWADTQDILRELMRRSRVAFVVMRPLTAERAAWWSDWGVHGGVQNDPEAVARVLGLVQLAVADILRADPVDGPEPGPDAGPPPADVQAEIDAAEDEDDDEGANNAA